MRPKTGLLRTSIDQIMQQEVVVIIFKLLDLIISEMT
jgi:hypothetical protein